MGLQEDLALQVIKPVVSALCHLNRMGFAHRDVKSENILVQFNKDSDTGDVAILDVRLIDFDMYVSVLNTPCLVSSQCAACARACTCWGGVHELRAHGSRLRDPHRYAFRRPHLRHTYLARL